MNTDDLVVHLRPLTGRRFALIDQTECLARAELLYAWFNFTCYHPPRATPGTSPSPGVGNCLERFCPGGRGAGQI